MTWLAGLGCAVIGTAGFAWSLCRAAALGDRETVAPDEPASIGDEIDLYLRLDGMTSAVSRAIEQLAAGQIAEAQVTLGEADRIEWTARLEEATARASANE